jgi:nitrile hydratase accessory protein
MTLALHERELFTWTEWTDVLGAQIAAARADGADTYYRLWLAALETLLARKDISSAAELTQYRQAWGRAVARTAHGQAIVLEAADLRP